MLFVSLKSNFTEYATNIGCVYVNVQTTNCISAFSLPTKTLVAVAWRHILGLNPFVACCGTLGIIFR